jgi:glucose-1-phosphate thymidylyltransferase
MLRGVVLAGGRGSRLYPLTKITNKHLLPIYDRPMIYYPLQTLVEAGITEIMVVTGGNNAGDFLRLLGNGREFGLSHLNYAYQEKEGGIAQAIGLAESFSAGGRIVVILGDNIFQGGITSSVERFKRQRRGARILLKRVRKPQNYGVAVLEGKKLVKVEEKPSRPKSDYAVTGVYLYDPQVFDIIRRLKPSSRGELEISDVNNHYIREGEMEVDFLQGWWADAGASVDSYLEANILAAKKTHKGERRFSEFKR